MDTSIISNSSSDFIPFSDSDCSPDPKNTFKQGNKRFSGYNRNFNNSFNRWSPKYNSPDKYNQQNWQRNKNHRKFYNNDQQQDNSNKNKYLHPSFLEDPWAHLMNQQKLNESKEQEQNKDT